MTTTFTPESAIASGFRRLQVVARIRESETITSFHLEPVEPEGWQPYRPGQFLVFRIPCGEAGSFELRNYSVSTFRARPGRYRISVKREPAPGAGLPDGRGSCYLHDHIEVGDELIAAGPRGLFTLDEESTRAVVLIGGGVGLTPLVAMLHRLAFQPGRRVFFIHACDNGRVHALREEVLDLGRSRPDTTVHFCYRFPTNEDRAALRFDSEGLVTRALLQSVLPLDDCDFYLCGPPSFMQAVYPTLRGLGVAKERIAYEVFGPAAISEEPGPPAAETALAAPPAAPATEAEAVTVTFRKSGMTAAWDSDACSLLDFAEAQGLTPDFSCRAGICSTCKSRLVSGNVAYFEEPLDDIDPGDVLLCCSRPVGPVTIDI